MAGENNIEFKPQVDTRANDILADKARNNPRDPVQSPEAVEAVRTVAQQNPSSENPIVPTQAPPLPALSFFPTAEAALTPSEIKGAIVDLFKNVTINGNSPSINGNSIDFNINTNMSASQQWNQANGINNQPPPSPAVPPTTQPDAAQTPAPTPPTTPSSQTQPQATTQPNQEDDTSVFSMAKPKTLKERARELEEERDADSSVFSMAKPKSLKTDLGRNVIDDVIDQAESESKAANGEGGMRRRGKDKIFDKIEEAIENEDFDKARKLNERVKNRELETELRGEGKDRDRRSTKDIAESEGIDTKGKSSKELREEILEKRREAQEKSDTKPTTEIQSIEVGKAIVDLIPLPVKRADDTDYRMIYAMSKATVPLKSGGEVPNTLEGSENSDKFTDEEYWIPLGGGSGTHPFKISVDGGDNPTFKVFAASSIINGTNGGPFNITGLDVDTSFSGSNYIVAQATVTSNPFKISDDGFTISAVGEDASQTNEVLLEDGKQTKLRLLIGRIVAETEGDSTKYTALQAVTTSFKTTVSFHNGVPVYVLQSAPTHQSKLVLPSA